MRKKIMEAQELKPIAYSGWVCPYCNMYESSKYDEVEEHMQKCSYNPNLPEQNCSQCANLAHIYVPDTCSVGGSRCACINRRPYCKKAIRVDVFRKHPGYNACYGFEPKS